MPIHDIASASYDDLQQNAHDIATLLGITAETTKPTFHLLDLLEEYDTKTAKECLQSLPLAVQVGNILGEFYDVDPDYQSVWTTALLHDIGKLAVPISIIDRSNEGKVWTDRDRRIMRIHPFAGATILRHNGFGEEVARPVEEHHHKQYGCPNYGRSPELSYRERMTRDCVAAADFTDAALNRTNTRNAGLSRLGREQEVIRNLYFLFDDYTNGSEVAHSVATGLLYHESAA